MKGSANLWVWDKTYYLVTFLPKNAWNWKKLDRERACFPSPPPPRSYQCRYSENCQVTQFYTTHFLSVLISGSVNTISIWKFDHAVHVNSVYSLWKNAHMWWHLRNLLCKTNCITQMFNAAMFRQRSKKNSWFDQGYFDVEIRVIL